MLTTGAFAAAENADEISPLSFPFTDVHSTDWYFSAIQFVHANSVMTGITTTTFAPHANFSRAMAAATLFRVYHGRPANAGDSAQNTFTDVPANAWFAPYIAWAARNGIVTGDEGRFLPNNTIDRQQFAAMLYRFADNMTNMDTRIQQGPQWTRFTDRGRTQPWAVNALTWANYHGFINGRTTTSIAPDAVTSRMEAATILTRFMGGVRLDLSTLIDVEFRLVRSQLGTPLDTEQEDAGNAHFFDTGVLVVVAPNGRIIRAGIAFFQDVDRAAFHVSGIDGTSTRAQVRTRFGPPDRTESAAGGVVVYFYAQGTTIFTFVFENARLVVATAERGVLPQAGQLTPFSEQMLDLFNAR